MSLRKSVVRIPVWFASSLLYSHILLKAGYLFSQFSSSQCPLIFQKLNDVSPSGGPEGMIELGQDIF
ncbi:hypothetical protein SAMN05216388_105215 [Halorientalis persicus]|uniref:Uncharacterized protein n=1 Tax=Halorientalis persicus TaxID=1367881 RepID=A0A1H8WA46_9EURY|nr:hypothetical protein SAMN05216388_105215 [Halorientalis persicus]